MDKQKVAILSTVANFDLYKKSSTLFPKDIQRYVIDGTNGMHGLHSIKYMMSKLKGKGIEWLVMADEDVIFTDATKVFSIIEDMETNHLTVCGVRDGGVILHRKENPYAINTFFSVLNFKEVESIWNEKEVLANQFVNVGEFPDSLAELPYEYNEHSVYEPYYCFYFWLRRKGKQFLFLDTKMNSDGIANIVYYKEREVLCHTWYARSYGINQKHTGRINEILKVRGVLDASSSSLSDVILYKKTTFALEQKIKKYYKKVCRKLFK